MSRGIIGRPAAPTPVRVPFNRPPIFSSRAARPLAPADPTILPQEASSLRSLALILAEIAVRAEASACPTAGPIAGDNYGTSHKPQMRGEGG